MGVYNHILLATDLLPDSRHVAEEAKKLAELFGAQLSLVHAVDPIPPYAYGYIGMTDIEQKLEEEAKKATNDLAGSLGMSDCKKVVERGPAKNVILNAAENLGVDLIVVGSHSAHGLAKFLGATANSVLHGADCDVLTIRYQAS